MIVFNFSSLGLTGTSSSLYAINSNTQYKLTLTFTTGPDATSLPWDNLPGVKIATINGNCRPSETVYGGDIQEDTNFQVNFSVRPNGDIYIEDTSVLDNNSTYTWILTVPFY